MKKQPQPTVHELADLLKSWHENYEGLNRMPEDIKPENIAAEIEGLEKDVAEYQSLLYILSALSDTIAEDISRAEDSIRDWNENYAD